MQRRGLGWFPRPFRSPAMSMAWRMTRCGQGISTMRVSLAQAAATVGRSRSTLLRSIRSGKLSAQRDELAGAWSIDMAELARVFSVPARNGQDGHGHSQADDQTRTGEVDTMATRLVAAEARLTDAQEQISDLRRRLDEANTERRQTADRLAAAQERIAALLTDQRVVPNRPPASKKRRRWWPWSRI